MAQHLPSIASGNQVCNPNCADFPTAPINNNKQIKVISLDGAETTTILKREENSKDPKRSKRPNIARINPISPTRLTNIAFIAALFASTLVNQKFIKR